MDARTLREFSECFALIKLKENSDIDPGMIGSTGEFFVVGEGQIDVSVKLPTGNKKTEYITNTLCTKKAGDILHVPAVEAVAKNLAGGAPGSPKRRLSITALLQRNHPPVSSPQSKPAEIPEPPPGLFDQLDLEPELDEDGNPKARSRRQSSMTTSYVNSRIESGSFTWMRDEDIKPGAQEKGMSPNSIKCRELIEASAAAAQAAETAAAQAAVEAKKQANKASTEKVLRQMDLTTINAPYGATLLHLDRNKLRAFEQARSHGGGTDVVGTFVDFELLRVMLTSNIQDYLKKVPFLAKVPTSRLHMLGEMTQFEVFNPQISVCSEGEVGDKIYVVLLGNLAVTAQGPVDEATKTRPTVHLADLRIGDYFGELAVLADIPRQASVKTTSKCLLISIARAPFRSLMKVIPDFGHTVQSLMKLYMISKFITGAFDPVSIKSMDVEKLQHDLFKTCSIAEEPAEKLLIEEGGPADSVYFIYHGKVRANKRAYPGSPKGAPNPDGYDVPTSDRHVGTLGPGQYFGEISILTKSPCRATLTTATKCMLLRIRQDEFLRSWCKVQGFRSQFLVRILGTNSRLEHVLEHNQARGHFEEFVTKEHAGENLRFYWSAYDFRGGYEDRSSKENYEMANELFRKYCSHDADEQVRARTLQE